MKILFLCDNQQDYIADAVLHGFKHLYNEYVIDYPKNSFMYSSLYKSTKIELYGKGFTLYYLLADIDIDRSNIKTRIVNGEFNLIVFSSIHRQFGMFLQLINHLTYNNTIILDGEDTPAMYPYHGFFWRQPFSWFLPRAHTRFKYFKREWTSDTKYYRYFKLIPKSICKFLLEPRNLNKISLSIPEEKIINVLPFKTKLFPKHIVDEEIAANVE